MFRRLSLSTGFRLASALLLIATTLTACETIRPVRTLPSWVRGIYVPMFENDTAEPGLEEVATQLTQEEFLADGRVKIVQKRDADLILKAIIKDYRVTVDSLSDEDIPDRSMVNVTADLKLYDPLDPEEPLASLGSVTATRNFRSDPRSARYVVKPDANREALALLARQIVAQTINGFPTRLRDVPDGVNLPRQGGPVRAEEEENLEDSLSRFPFF